MRFETTFDLPGTPVIRRYFITGARGMGNYKIAKT